MRLGIFRIRTVSAANLVVILLIAGMFSTLFFGPLFLQRVLGYSPIGVGAAILPMAASTGIVSMFLAAKMTVRFGARQTLLLGLALVAAGLLLFSIVPLHASYPAWLLPVMLLWGIGAGFAYPAVIQLAMSGTPMEEVGLASGIVNTSQQVGGALALAVLATVSTTRINHLELHNIVTETALASGYHLAFAIAGFIVLAAVVLTPILLRRSDGAMRATETLSSPLKACIR
jgi:MFS family permease